MKYFFRDRIPTGQMLAAYRKTTAEHAPDHHDYHPHFELYFCKDARAQEIVLGTGRVLVNAPCVVLTAPFSIHAMSPDAEAERFERFIIYFNEEFGKSFGERILPRALFTDEMNCLYPLSPAAAGALAEDLPALFDNTLPEAERALLLARFLCRLPRLSSVTDRIHFAGAETYIPHVLRYLYENPTAELTAEAIAARFHVSRAKLDRDFTASVGQTLHQAVNDLRLAHAKQLLESTTLPIGEIAARVGISSEYYFYAFFRRMTGGTPQDYRKHRTR